MTEMCLKCEDNLAEWHVVAGCLNKHIWDAKRCLLCVINLESLIQKHQLPCLVSRCKLNIYRVNAEKLYPIVTDEVPPPPF